MNKLVSRNLILRFKLGRKIVKAEEGTLFWMGRMGDWYSGNKKGNTYINPILITPEKIVPLKDGRTIAKINGQWYNQKGLKIVNFKGARIESGKKNNPLSTQVTQKKNWNNEFTNNFTNTLTNAQRLYLDSKGINYTNAAEVLKFLMDLLQTDLGGYKNDGKWGKNSILAWKDFATNNIPENFDVQRNQETMTIGNKPYVEQPTTPTPTLGYRTYNTYEGNDFSNKLKHMGIGSNADLIDFMYKTKEKDFNWGGDTWARQFRSDVDRALGGLYSDENIKKVFGISGNWGKGFLGRGDIGDFQNALQINAGTWNGIYDNKLQNLVKNIDWSKFKYYKQGGNLLPSRNIIERFKYRKGGLINFIKEALPPR